MTRRQERVTQNLCQHQLHAPNSRTHKRRADARTTPCHQGCHLLADGGLLHPRELQHADSFDVIHVVRLFYETRRHVRHRRGHGSAFDDGLPPHSNAQAQIKLWLRHASSDVKSITSRPSVDLHLCKAHMRFTATGSAELRRYWTGRPCWTQRC